MAFYEKVKEIDIILKGRISEKKVNKILLLIKEDISYQKYFFKEVKKINWYLPLKEEGYFDPVKNPYPIPGDDKGTSSIPEWNVLPYLERISQEINISENKKYISELLAIIKTVSTYKDSNGCHVDNYRTWYYFIKILMNIPNEKILVDIIDLIPIWLDSKNSASLPGSEISMKLLPKFLTDNADDLIKAEIIIKYITALKTIKLERDEKNISGEKEETRLIIDSYWLKESFKKYSNTIGEKCSRKVVDDLSKKIKSLLKRKEDKTYFSFYEDKDYTTNDPTDILTFILKRILFAKAKKDIDSTRSILSEFFKDEYLYFPKMALFIIGQNIEEYSNLFWKILDTDIGDVIMEKTLFWGDELKRLLNNLGTLTDKQKGIINKKVEISAKKLYGTENSEKPAAQYKQGIYDALSNDPYFKNLYEEHKKVTTIDAWLSPAIMMSETRVGPGPSPLAKEKIIEMPNDKLAEYLSTFVTRDSWRGPTVGGLSNVISEVAKEMPNKFINEFRLFKSTGFIYIYEIISGIKNAWNEKKEINWQKVFEFIKLYIDQKEFWEDKFIVEKGEWLGGANHEWVAGIAAELIQDGSRDDSWAFPEHSFDNAEKIVFMLLSKLRVEDDKDISDYVSYTLNTALGKAIIAFILLTLRIARVNKTKGISNDIKWSIEYKTKYDEILERKIIEGYVCLGRYLPNFYYLDKEWIEDKIRYLEREKGSKHWEAFMVGYLSIGKIYDDIHNIMRPHYQHSIEFDFKEKREKEFIIQHISLLYLRGLESLTAQESLFKQLLDKFIQDHIQEIINFFWMERRYIVEQEENKDTRKKTIEFWRWLYEKYKSADLSRNDRKILSYTGNLTTILPQIDKENFEWLKLAASNIHETYNSSFFIEYLDALKEKGNRSETAKYIGEIYLCMLEKSTPDFDKNHIRSIVEFLYDAGVTENAKKICNIYGSRGYEFLRDIYEKHTKIV